MIENADKTKIFDEITTNIASFGFVVQKIELNKRTATWKNDTNDTRLIAILHVPNYTNYTAGTAHYDDIRINISAKAKTPTGGYAIVESLYSVKMSDISKFAEKLSQKQKTPQLPYDLNIRKIDEKKYHKNAQNKVSRYQSINYVEIIRACTIKSIKNKPEISVATEPNQKPWFIIDCITTRGSSVSFAITNITADIEYVELSYTTSIQRYSIKRQPSETLYYFDAELIMEAMRGYISNE